MVVILLLSFQKALWVFWSRPLWACRYVEQFISNHHPQRHVIRNTCRPSSKFHELTPLLRDAVKHKSGNLSCEVDHPLYLNGPACQVLTWQQLQEQLWWLLLEQSLYRGFESRFRDFAVLCGSELHRNSRFRFRRFLGLLQATSQSPQADSLVDEAWSSTSKWAEVLSLLPMIDQVNHRSGEGILVPALVGVHFSSGSRSHFKHVYVRLWSLPPKTL